ncbi:MAG TPA: crosslink repair DNA glycosylase YcaQ family protein [Candidatus Dormibacteraeota bacterium]|nr:crosslink repair DNA glycosylase YcaQ family protein [Candidatus Dormibacteraeota bacterium]
MKLSPVEARRLAINAQRLAGPRLPATAEGLLEVARSLRCIQIDAVGIAGAPTQLLVPFSRVGPYDRALVDRLAFEDKTLFHYFAHAASLVLTEDFPIHWGSMRKYAARPDTWGARIHEWMAENQALRRQVLEQIAARGPLRSRDFENTARTDWRSSGWTEGRSVNRMLEFLWVEGELTVAGRNGQERLWDLSERWFPPWTPRERLAPEERSDRGVSHALRALGAATVRQVSNYFLRRSLRTGYPDLAGSLTRLGRSGAVLPVTIEGWKGDWYLHRDSLAFVEMPWQPRTELLSPFDNLIADRQRTSQLFGFDYTIEIYVPPAKRRRGYYAMPVLSGDTIIGTVDPSFDRRSRVLTLKRVALEPGVRLTDAARRAVTELGRFVGAEEVVYPAG